MASTFSNSSILAYYIFDEVGPGSMPEDSAVKLHEHSFSRSRDAAAATETTVCILSIGARSPIEVCLHPPRAYHGSLSQDDVQLESTGGY